jgi:hypothetical protein
MADPLSITCAILALVGTVIKVTTVAIDMVDGPVTAHADHRRALRNLQHELHKTLQGTTNMYTVLRAMFGDSEDQTVKRIFKECATSQTVFFFRLTPASSSASQDCVSAVRQLTTALEATQVLVAGQVGSEEVTRIDPKSQLPENRKSFAFVQAVLKHTISPSTINDAITALEELQFQVVKCRDNNEIAFQLVFRLYDLQRFRTFKRPRADSITSVSSVATLATISSRIEETSMSASANHSSSPNAIEWLEEQARRVALHSLLAGSHPPAPVEDIPQSEDGLSEDVSTHSPDQESRTHNRFLIPRRLIPCRKPHHLQH